MCAFGSDGKCSVIELLLELARSQAEKLGGSVRSMLLLEVPTCTLASGFSIRAVMPLLDVVA